MRAAKNSSFTDKSDFEEAKRLYRSGAVQQNHDDKGGVAWDIDNWSFLLNGKEYDSINPSLQRQATLNMEYGLFEVVPGIYPPPGGSALLFSLNAVAVAVFSYFERWLSFPWCKLTFSRKTMSLS